MQSSGDFCHLEDWDGVRSKPRCAGGRTACVLTTLLLLTLATSLLALSLSILALQLSEQRSERSEVNLDESYDEELDKTSLYQVCMSDLNLPMMQKLL